MRRTLNLLLTVAVILVCCILPPRWMWPACALVTTIIVAPHRATRRSIFQRHGLLIVGVMTIFVLRPLLDPLAWLPWVMFLLILLVVRDHPRWTRGWRTIAAVGASICTIILVLQPDVRRAKPPKSTSGHTVLVCLGDSLTSGVDINGDGGTYVARLRTRFDFPVVNAGRANDRVADALARLNRDVLANHPTMVLVFIGGNDGLDGTPRSVFAIQLDELMRRLSAARVRIILVEVPAGIIFNPLAGIYRHAADRYGAVLVPESWLRFRFTIELLMGSVLTNRMTIDGIHLSPHGADLVADWLEPYVKQSL